ncbi:hypothetical protein [Nocardia mexicana]|uniref:hypothetical protein n=1 Tax=Nocardia mexicana TaxID=279262 RepID=UPI000B1A082D|nr:hypothetical protein [Nocardia mexicana]
MTIPALLAAFDSTIGGGVGSRIAPLIVLADTLIHHQDIRRPLGLARSIPSEHLATI